MNLGLRGQISIALFRTDGVGDAILSTACLDFLSHLDAQARVYWISYEPISGLIEKSYPDAIQIRINRKRTNLQILKEISEATGELDHVIDLKRSSRSVFLCSQLSRIKKAQYHTWNKQSITRSLMVARAFFRKRKSNRRYKQNPILRYQMMLDCLTRAIDIQASSNSLPSIPVLKNDPDIPLQKPLNLKWISVIPGGKYHLKRAPIQTFQKILQEVLDRSSEKVIFLFLGDKDDRHVAEELINTIHEKGVTKNLCGKYSLYQNAQILSQCDLSLSNDTALAHLSEAVKTPVAMLFGPTVEEFGYSPFLHKSRAFSVPLGCRPCTKGGAGHCRYKDQLCFQQLDTKEISSFILDQLN